MRTSFANMESLALNSEDYLHKTGNQLANLAILLAKQGQFGSDLWYEKVRKMANTPRLLPWLGGTVSVGSEDYNNLKTLTNCKFLSLQSDIEKVSMNMEKR